MGEGATVAVAAMTLAGTTVAGLIWVVKYFAKTLSQDLKEHTKAAQQQRQASLKAAKASMSLEKTVKEVGKQAEITGLNSQEQLRFMKKLNGKLENAIVQKVTEQTVTHQTVQHVEEVKE